MNKEHKGKNLSKERLELCDLNMYITNTTEEKLPHKKVREYYSLRWQIEIIFKAWKTVYKIDKVKKMKIERFECINYGAMILIMLTTDLLAYCKYLMYVKGNKEISELKSYKIMKSVLTCPPSNK
jgi:IS4 transposase